jgi:hypothetical protein
MFAIFDQQTGAVVAFQDTATVTAGQGSIDIGEDVDAARGMMVFDGALVPIPAAPETPDEAAARLERARKVALSEVNNVVGSIRRAYITDIPGQEMVYQHKLDEARAVVADETPDEVDYPLLSADVAAGGAQDLHQAAQIVLNIAAAWTAIVSGLERIRLTGANGIAAASESDIAGVMLAFYEDLDPYLNPN